MKLKLHFPFAPLSQNNIERSARANFRYKTKEAVQYKEAITQIVQSNVMTKKFLESFDPEVHSLRIAFLWSLNYKELITQSGKAKRVKRNSLDCDNPIKFTQDCIMQAIGIDDVFINDINALRVPSKSPSTFYVILDSHDLLSDVQWRDFLI